MGPSLYQRAVLGFAAAVSAGKRKVAPSADRNKEPISIALARYPPFITTAAAGCCLEVGSGTGQHAQHIGSRFPHVVWQPTEYAGGHSGPEEPSYLDISPVFDSIVAHCGGMLNVLRPAYLDVSASTWTAHIEATAYNAIFACNVLHISPWRVTEGLVTGAARVLAADGRLFVYGPFKVDGATVPSNEAFDLRLREQNPEWGVRDSTAIATLAASHGLTLLERVEMPANNFLLVFGREPQTRF